MSDVMRRPAISKAPCAKCPFRKDVPIYLRVDRRAEIARSLADGRTFWCHSTVNYTEDDEGETYGDPGQASECAGAAKALLLGGATTQSMRIAERLGLADLDALEEVPVEVWSLHEWQRLAEGATADDPVEDEEALGVEPCSVANPGCLAPAGYLGLGGAVVLGVEAADEACKLCGDPVCSECINDDGTCEMCHDEEDDEWAN